MFEICEVWGSHGGTCVVSWIEDEREHVHVTAFLDTLPPTPRAAQLKMMVEDYQVATKDL
jgi:hypothetical protein